MTDAGVQTGGCEALLAWRDGDAAAARRLVDIIYPQLVRFFRNKVAQAPDEDDLVQQSMVALCKSDATPATDRALWGLVYGIARNMLREYVRKRYKRSRERVDFGAVCVADIAPRSLSSVAVRGHELQAFVAALRRVPLEDQTLLEMRFFEAHTAAHIGELLDMPRGSVQRHIDRAIARLQERIADEPRFTSAPTTEPTVEELESWAAAVRARLP